MQYVYFVLAIIDSEVFDDFHFTPYKTSPTFTHLIRLNPRNLGVHYYINERIFKV